MPGHTHRATSTASSHASQAGARVGVTCEDARSWSSPLPCATDDVHDSTQQEPDGTDDQSDPLIAGLDLPHSSCLRCTVANRSAVTYHPRQPARATSRHKEKYFSKTRRRRLTLTDIVDVMEAQKDRSHCPNTSPASFTPPITDNGHAPTASYRELSE